MSQASLSAAEYRALDQAGRIAALDVVAEELFALINARNWSMAQSLFACNPWAAKAFDQLFPAPGLLHRAAKGGGVQLVECMLRAGSNPNAVNDRGETCLQTILEDLSSPWSRVAFLAGLLIDHGADCTVLDHQGKSLVYTLHSSRPDLTKRLIDPGAPLDCKHREPVMHRVRDLIRNPKYDVQGQRRAVFDLVLTGLGSNLRECAEKPEASMLIGALRAQAIEQADQLVEAGLDPLQVFDDGRTLMHTATDLNMIRWLEDHGLEVDVPSARGRTALHEALWTCMDRGFTDERIAVAGALMAAGANVDAQDSVLMAGSPREMIESTEKLGALVGLLRSIDARKEAQRVALGLGSTRQFNPGASPCR